MFVPTSWYWIVGGNAAEIWSSASLGYVPATDATYAAWLAAGNQPTAIGSAAELYQVMQQDVAPVLQAAGVQVTSTSTPALNGAYPIDPAAQSIMSAIAAGVAAGKGLPSGTSTFAYPNSAGAEVTFTADQFTNFAAACEAYLYAFNQALAARVGGSSTAMPSTALTIA
jgi:hypothetical protein